MQCSSHQGRTGMVFPKSPFCLSASNLKNLLYDVSQYIKPGITSSPPPVGNHYFISSSLHVFIIILFFILVNIFTSGFSHPHPVQVSVSWHEMSVVQSLLFLETGDLLFQLSSKVSATHSLLKFGDSKGVFSAQRYHGAAKPRPVAQL